MSQVYNKPLPMPDEDSKGLWEGLKKGQLLLQHCLDCSHIQYYQQGICRNCHSERLEHRPASGKGVIHSYSVVYRAPAPEFKEDVPYAVILVELEEGPRMISTLTGVDDPEEARIGMPVTINFETVTEEITLPRFRPAE